MLFLLLAVCASALISTLMRLSEEKVRSNMVMFFSNYVVCTGLSLAFQLSGRLPEDLSGLPFAAGMGLVSGFLYLASFVLLQTCIRRNGVVLSAVFMKLGVLIPTLMALLVYRENPGLPAMLGFVIALGAIILMNAQDGGGEAAGAGYLLIVLLISGGVTDAMSNIFDKGSQPGFRDLYLAITFGAAGICAAAMALILRQKPHAADILWGALIGVPNYFTSRFFLLALSQGVPAAVAYPAYNIGAILLVSLAGIFLFRERLTRRKYAGMALILLALILLNL